MSSEMVSKRLLIMMVTVAILGFGTAISAKADGVVLVGGQIHLSGTGFGTRLTVLSLQATPNESGATTFAAPTGTGDSTNQDALRTIAELKGIGINGTSDLAFLYNQNETGSNPDATLQSLTITFYNGTGGVVANFVLPNPFLSTPLEQGNGVSGFLLSLQYESAAQRAAIDALFTSGVGSVGMAATILGTDDGADSIFVFKNSIAEPVPEPATMLLLGTGLVGVAASLRKRLRQ